MFDDKYTLMFIPEVMQSRHWAGRMIHYEKPNDQDDFQQFVVGSEWTIKKTRVILER